ncbi:ras guanine nucleotide exchange factor domain-containing protein [Piptocephalis cylindrospora]|uniref:Ras guanine nucleotide exchange factor domain-containing protein n=1 Tax=Piptocephalis cylindrospora TaxID=1907219 RepID=A0A4P9Y789_9FUNG|nr:ras guanine nucleotide exchange factor domain-containing protein [Piptocephalis cylindrospora]|eukprot:RKP14976.1 ras guanine nucleotide exchange factor domain-containing protein [Piptocephalis cylindrospora]
MLDQTSLTISQGKAHGSGDASDPTPPTDLPWYLGMEYGEADLLYGADRRLRGGSLPALVEILTQHTSLDTAFNQSFLLTYRAVISSTELIRQLLRRFSLPPPPNLSPEDLTEWSLHKQGIIRLRVFNILRLWVETYCIPEVDAEAMELLHHFALTDLQHWGKDRMDRVKDPMAGAATTSGVRPMILNISQQAPSPILPRNLQGLRIVDIDPLELARQLTLLDAAAFVRISYNDFLSRARSARHRVPSSPSSSPSDQSPPSFAGMGRQLTGMIESTNHLTHFIIAMILAEEEIRWRCTVIKHFILVAEKCRQLNNYNSLMAILAAFSSAPIHRLKRTWEFVTGKAVSTLEGLKKLMNPSRNYAEYLQVLHSVNPPCVPFPGVFMQHLAFIDYGNEDYITDHPGLINVYKMLQRAQVVREIQLFQSVPYALSHVPEIQALLREGLRLRMDETVAFERSTLLEPKERDDEKIARLLQESGFL